jgi:membrane dipeptidase
MSKLNCPTTPDSLPDLFPFGLSDVQERHAADLHKRAVIVDLVSQQIGGTAIYDQLTSRELGELYDRMGRLENSWEKLTEAEYWPYHLSSVGENSVIEDWYRASGLTCGTYGIGVHDGNDPLALCLDKMNAIYEILPWISCVTSAAEIREAKRKGHVALYAQWQPLNSIPKDLSCLERAMLKGLRCLTLTYNSMDNVGVGCAERVDAGLSLFGVEVVRYCNDAGIIVDVSHCGHLTTMDACRHSRMPVVAHHTAASQLHAHPRCKKNDALRAIADTGGIIGIVAVPSFLSSGADASIDTMLDHIDFVVDLVGCEHVAIGTDWPIQSPSSLFQETFGQVSKGIGFNSANSLDLSANLFGYRDGRDLINITRGLVQRGYGEREIFNIMGENALRLFAQVWK